MQALAPMVETDLVQQVTALESNIKRWQTDGPAKQLELIQQNNLAAAVAEVSNGQSLKRFDEILENLRSMRAEIGQINAELIAYITRVRAIGTAIATALGILGVVVAGYLVRVFRAMALLTEQLDHERQRAEQAVVVAEDANDQVQLQLDDMRWRNQQLRDFNRIAASAGAPLQVEVQADRLIDELVDALGVESGAVWRLNATQQQLELISKRGNPSPAMGTTIPLTDPGIVAQAIADDTPHIVEDLDDAEYIARSRTLGPPFFTTIRSAVALPLHGRDGMVGAVLLATSAPGHFRTADFDYYVALASHAGLLLENAELYEAVIREQQRLEVLFEQSPEGIIFAEAETGTIVLANHAARTLIGDPLSPGTTLTTETSNRLRRPNGTLFGDDMPLLRALRGEEQIGIEIVIEHYDGQRIPTLFNCVPLHDTSGELRGALALFQDLSRFREVERLKSDFVAMVSHELRTPLTAIQGCAQSLLRSSARPDAQRTEEFLQIIESQSARLHELIDNLLNMSQMEAGALQLRKAPVQPARLARSIARQASERLNDVRVHAELPPSLPTISADPLRIEQVLLNLVDNARKFSPQNGLI